MRDFPVFTTQNGVGSLILKEIPYWGRAYLNVKSASSMGLYIEECAAFCKAVGAEHLFASVWNDLTMYPLHNVIYEMRGSKELSPDSCVQLFPITDETAEKWRSVHNEKMKHISNAHYLSAEECKKLQNAGEAYFVHKNGLLMGIGAVSGNTIKAIATVCPGAGAQVLAALMQLCTKEYVDLQVASDNLKAIRLYEKMGFIKTAEISRWYQIF